MQSLEGIELGTLALLTHITGCSLSQRHPQPNRNSIREMAASGEGKPTDKVQLLGEALSDLLRPLRGTERWHLLDLLRFASFRFGACSEFGQRKNDSRMHGTPALCGSRENKASFRVSNGGHHPALFLSFLAVSDILFQFRSDVSKQLCLGFPIGTSMKYRPLRY